MQKDVRYLLAMSDTFSFPASVENAWWYGYNKYNYEAGISDKEGRGAL